MIVDEQTSSLSELTYEEAIARARALAPAVEKRALAAEEQRRQPMETIQEIIDAGLARLLVPRRWGGYELSIDALIDSAIEIAKADASAGWCYAFLVIHGCFLAHFPEQAQHDVWTSNPDAMIMTTLAPAGHFRRVDGGYQLSGNWAWSSGVDHCQWSMLTAVPESQDGPPQVFLLPSSDYTVLDTWFVAGLSASGSKNVEVKEQFVPAHRTILLPELMGRLPPQVATNTGPLYRRPLPPQVATNTGPLYRRPLLAMFPIILSALVLGTTQRAYQTWRDTNRSKSTAFTNEQVASFTHQQIRLAEIAMDIEAAQALHRKALDILLADEPVSSDRHNRIRLSCAATARLCVQAIERIYTNSGASANYNTNPLQRYWRDVHAMSVHPVLNFDKAGEAFGRAELGLPPKSFDPFAL
jgi:3-hydroxy-9,10-secoandrosta-1,3,5(10)-triene-9,17-dione monooxygenase